MNRGEKLDDLVAKSEDLSGQSKAFYTTVSRCGSFIFMLNLMLLLDQHSEIYTSIVSELLIFSPI